MTQKPHSRTPSLKVVGTDGSGATYGADHAEPIVRDVDWSILMARAQDGDGAAYHRLLQDIVPYLRSLAARRHRDPNDAEDAVQDILLTIHHPADLRSGSAVWAMAGYDRQPAIRRSAAPTGPRQSPRDAFDHRT